MDAKTLQRERFAANLKALRTYYGYSQEHVAASLNVKRTAYSGYELAKAEPSLLTLWRMQDLYRVGADLLLTADLSTVKKWEWRQLLAQAAPRTVTLTPIRA